jgi:TatD DNase family protein
MTVDNTELRWTDNHCHLPDGPEAADVVAAAVAEGVQRLIDVGTDVERSAQACERAGRLPGVWATVGLHPHDARHGLDGLVELLDLPKVVAVGECGLDYHYDYSPRDVQRAIFADQIQLAHERKLPLVIHTRSAWADTFDVLDAEGIPEHTVFHCFTGGPDEARQGLDRGAVLSFSGIVTFPSAPEVREAAALCPADRYMVETDAPYLAPKPNRGKKNQPGWVPLVGAGVAAARGCSVAEVARQSWDTAESCFGLG